MPDERFENIKIGDGFEAALRTINLSLDLAFLIIDLALVGL